MMRKFFSVIALAVLFRAFTFAQDSASFFIADSFQATAVSTSANQLDSSLLEDANLITDLAAQHAEPKWAYDWRTQRHSLVVSYGMPSSTGMIVDLLAAIFSFGKDSANVYLGTFSLQYGYNALWWLRVGGRFNYNCYWDKTRFPVTHIAEWCARVDFTYLNRRYVKLYSGLEVGIGLYANVYPNDREEPTSYSPFPAYNFCLLGIHAGGDRVFGMAELSIGSTELLRAGIGVHF